MTKHVLLKMRKKRFCVYIYIVNTFHHSQGGWGSKRKVYKRPYMSPLFYQFTCSTKTHLYCISKIHKIHIQYIYNIYVYVNMYNTYFVIPRKRKVYKRPSPIWLPYFIILYIPLLKHIFEIKKINARYIHV